MHVIMVLCCGVCCALFVGGLILCERMQVGSLWEIDDGEGGEMGKRGGMKRKRAGEAEGREKIEDFLQLNWHILSDYERDGTKGLQQGIEPTLGLMRSHRQPPKPVPEERPKKLTPPVQAVKTETVVSLLVNSFLFWWVERILGMRGASFGWR